MFGLFALALAQNDLVAGLLNRHQIGGNRLRVAALEAERRHVRVPDHQTLAQPGDERLEIHRAREPPERWSIGVAALPRRANGMTPGTGLLDLGVAALDLAELGTGGTGRGHEREQRDGQSHRHSIRPHGDARLRPLTRLTGAPPRRRAPTIWRRHGACACGAPRPPPRPPRAARARRPPPAAPSPRQCAALPPRPQYAPPVRSPRAPPAPWQAAPRLRPRGARPAPPPPGPARRHGAPLPPPPAVARAPRFGGARPRRRGRQKPRGAGAPQYGAGRVPRRARRSRARTRTAPARWRGRGRRRHRRGRRRRTAASDRRLRQWRGRSVRQPWRWC